MAGGDEHPDGVPSVEDVEGGEEGSSSGPQPVRRGPGGTAELEDLEASDLETVSSPTVSMDMPAVVGDLDAESRRAGDAPDSDAILSFDSAPATESAGATLLRSTQPADQALDDPPTSVSPSLGELYDLEQLPLVPRDRYDVEEAFAQGGIGRISRARDVRLDRVVALKELRRRSSRYAQIRFAREIRITARLSHPNIVPLHEAGRWPTGEPFFVMKLVEGESLDQAIEAADTRRARMTLLGHVTDVADAIAYAHAQGVVHRDLKPANVLVGPFGETVVIDWGLAKASGDPEDESLAPSPSDESVRERYKTTDGAVMGTPPYMAPEQAAGRTVDERSDVYAVGAILYHLLSGRVPYFEAPPRRVLQRVVSGPPTPLRLLEPDLPADLLAIVDKSMARDPEDRYRTASEMAEELRRFTTGGLVDAYSYSFVELLQRFVQRHVAAVAVGGLALVLLLSFAAWSFRNIAEERDRAEASARSAEQSASAEASARAQAVDRLELAILAGAEASLDRDPTLSLGLLKQLPEVPFGASTIAADAVGRGVSRTVFHGAVDRMEAVVFSPDGATVAAGGLSGDLWRWSLDGEGKATPRHRGRLPALAWPVGGSLWSVGYDGNVVVGLGDEAQRLDVGVAVRAVDASSQVAVTVSDRDVQLWSPPSLRRGRSVNATTDRPVFARIAPGGRWGLSGSHGRAVIVHDLEGERSTRLEHPAEVEDAAFARDGSRFATASKDGRVRVYEVERDEPRHDFIAHRGPVKAVAFTAEGLVTAGFDGRVLWWDLARDRFETLHEHDERVETLTVSKDGHRIATGSWDKTIAAIDLPKRDVQVLRGHRDVVAGLAFDAPGTGLASASWDREVRLWELPRTPARTIHAHRVGVKAVAFSPDGTRIASGGHDDAVRIYRVADGVLERELIGHEDHVFRVLFSPDGRLVASSSDDLTVRLWPAEGGPPTVFEGHEADVEELAFAADGRWLASAGEDDAVGLWDVSAKSGGLLRGHRGAITDVAFGGGRLASSSLDGTVRFWDPASRKRVETWDLGKEVAAIAFAPTGDALAAVSGDALWLWRGDGGQKLDLEAMAAASVLAYAPAGDRVAVGSARGAVWSCVLATSSCHRFEGHGARINALAFTPDGAHLVSGSGDGTGRIWDVATGESTPLRGHQASVFDVALSPDGSLVATASGDMTFRLWPLRPPPDRGELSAYLDEATRFVAPSVVPPTTPAPSPTLAP